MKISGPGIEDPQVVSILEEAIGRVRAIQDLYEHMLLEREFEEIDAGRYLGTIAESVVALADGATAITLDCSLDPLSLQPWMMMPLGIIVNELLTNAVKYAFTGRPGGWRERWIRFDPGVNSLQPDQGGTVHRVSDVSCYRRDFCPDCPVILSRTGKNP